MPDAEIVVRVVGPAAEGGRLALAELARLAGEFQATLERIALALLGTETTAGRRPRDVAQAVRLDLVGLRAGSAILEMQPAENAIFGHDLLTNSVDTLMGGIDAIAARSNDAPPAFTPQVLDGLIRLTGGLSPDTIDHLEIAWRGAAPAHLDRGFREHVRWLRRKQRSDVVTIVGRLHEGDFDPLVLRCRIDTLTQSVPCSFTSDLRDAVLAAMDSMVVATGVAELQPDESVRTLALDELTVIDEAQRHGIAELAREQGIQPVQDVSDFATLTDLDDGEFGDFMDDVMSARS
jgi:hypothetical protein